MTTGAANSRLITELGTGLAFLTRLPVRGASGGAGSLARAAWTFPLVGALVGACGALAYWGAAAVGLPPVVAGVLAVAATLLVTGALHEDGLADTADGFGAGVTPRAQARDHARQPDRHLRRRGAGLIYPA